MKFIDTNGTNLIWESKKIVIQEFNEIKDIDELGVTLADEKIMNEMTERGKKFK